ncbi:unnamed protein product [Arctogadus glacialis]
MPGLTASSLDLNICTCCSALFCWGTTERAQQWPTLTLCRSRQGAAGTGVSWGSEVGGGRYTASPSPAQLETPQQDGRGLAQPSTCPLGLAYRSDRTLHSTCPCTHLAPAH